MPITICPTCGRDVQFPDYFHGNVIACPSRACGRPVQLPYADGTMPPTPTTAVPPPLPDKNRPASQYYLRKPQDPSVVVGPLPRERLRQMAAQGKLHLTDEISPDKREWRTAERRDPGLFGKEERTCRTCGAVLQGAGDQCRACVAAATGDPAVETYGVSTTPVLQARALSSRVERRLSAPRPLADFVSARAADAIVGVTTNGWLGLWTTADDEPAKTWEFDRGPNVQLAIADRGGKAVVAVGTGQVTRLCLADFEYAKLRELTEIDGRVHALAFDPDGKRLALVDDGPDVRLYRVEPWKRLDRFPVRGSRFAFDLSTDRLATADHAGNISLYDLRTGKRERSLSGPRNEKGCLELPLRLAFSRDGRSLFAAGGIIVQFPAQNVSGIDPKMAFLLGAAAGGLAGGFVATTLNDNTSVFWERYRNSKVAEQQRNLEFHTVVRAWETKGGGLVADFKDIFQQHHTGLADAFFCPWGTAVATVGENNAHAFDLDGGHLGLVYDMTDPTEVQRATAARGAGGSLIRKVDFTSDGRYALVLVAGDSHIRQVPWPGNTAAAQAYAAESMK